MMAGMGLTEMFTEFPFIWRATGVGPEGWYQGNPGRGSTVVGGEGHEEGGWLLSRGEYNMGLVFRR